ncbi:DUF1016 N-terminal domain-containing protein [Succinimonas sp.]|uniref:DUF1016 N-terminal domain-containing protein n=1 Tax=Succinimonas sp. TaxID=1936151 RepID=UPI0038672DA2
MDSNVSHVKYSNTRDILQDLRNIIEGARVSAYQAVNFTLVQRNWLIGRRIAEEELRGGDRAQYRLEVIKTLSRELTAEHGKGFTKKPLLSWTHYRTLLQVKDDKARAWYTREAAEQAWAVRALQQNIDTQYYCRLNIISEHRSCGTGNAEAHRQLSEGQAGIPEESCHWGISWLILQYRYDRNAA